MRPEYPHNVTLSCLLEIQARDNDTVETICLVGCELQDWDTPRRKEESEKTLQPKNIRVVTYQQLIRDAEISYSNYLEKSKEKGRINSLLEAIEQRLLL